MKLTQRQRDRLAEILTNAATACSDAVNGIWDKSDDGFVAMQAALEEGLQILGVSLPEYESRPRDAD